MESSDYNKEYKWKNAFKTIFNSRILLVLKKNQLKRKSSIRVSKSQIPESEATVIIYGIR